MVLAVRLKKDESTHLAMVSKKQHLNKSDAAKELMRRGFIMYQLDEFKAGNLSIGRLAETLDLSILETLNLVSKYNAHPTMPADYLVEASETARQLLGGR